MDVPAQRQDSRIITLGDYVRHSINKNTLSIECANALVEVIVYTDEIIRVKAINAKRDFEDFSYAVTLTPANKKYTCEETKEALILKTSKVIVEILKKPLRIRFLNLKGDVINEDEKSFGISWIGTEVTCYKTLQKDERFIGLGEKTGNLDRHGNFYTHWNNDYFAYPTDGDPLYISTPFYMGINGTHTYGIFFDNTYKTVVDFAASNNRFASFQAPDGEMNYYFIYGEDISDIVNHYTQLTGRIQMPPLWSLGFQQCRYSYYPEHEVMNIARNFRERDIPADVIYLDIHYMDEYKAFTWDKERFPNPSKMIARLKEMGFQVVLIIDPGIKVDKEYSPYKEGIKNNYFITYPDGKNYTGSVWPGPCHFPDFTNPDVRKWWGKNYKQHIAEGVEGYWNDMNEPSTWGKHIPGMVEFNYEGYTASHRKAHNVYGMQMARSTYEGVKKQLDNKRPFVLTRSGYSGIQRYAAAWTGDNVATDDHMLAGVRLLNSMGLAGMAFCGYDVGGFAGDASQNLYARWIALGAFSPLFRAHSMINSRDAEPWAFGEEVEDIARNYIKLRYRLLPYIYSTFYEAAQTGMPVQRSLAINYTYDSYIYNPAYQNEYLFGHAFLVCPVESYKEITKIYLPEGEWYSLFTDALYKGEQEMYIECGKEHLPVFIKAGSIIPMQADIEHTKQTPSDKTLHLHLYKGSADNTFVYYEDDGETFNYEKGKYYKRTIQLSPDGELRIGDTEGTYSSRYSTLRVYYHGFGEVKPVFNDKLLKVKHADYSFVAPLSNFDPWQKSGEQKNLIKNLPYVELDLITDPIHLFLKPR